MKNAPKKILYLVSHPIQYQAPLLRRLASRDDIDLKVVFILNSMEKGYYDSEFQREVKWDVPLLEGYDYEFLEVIGASDKLGFFSPFPVNLRKVLRDFDPDLIWMHGWNSIVFIYAVLISRFRKSKIVIRGETGGHLVAPSWIKKSIKKIYLKVFFRLIDGALYIGRMNKEFYTEFKIPEKKLFFVPYAIDNDYFNPKKVDQVGVGLSIRAEFGIPPDSPLVLYASKLTKRKHAPMLVRAFCEACRTALVRSEPHLIIVGDGEDRSVVEKIISKNTFSNVTLAGFKNQSELVGYYSAADVFVLPSENEPWGLVVNEAMVSGTAIIASNEVGSVFDLVQDSENGFVIDVQGMESALVEKLTYCFANPRHLERMKAKSRELISKWSYQEDIEGVCEAVEGVVG